MHAMTTTRRCSYLDLDIIFFVKHDMNAGLCGEEKSLSKKKISRNDTLCSQCPPPPSADMSLERREDSSVTTPQGPELIQQLD
jgi:hypothetical protein